MKNQFRIISVVFVVVVVTLACNAANTGVSTQPGLVNTQVAMAMTQTAMSNPPPAPANTLVVPQTDPGLVQTQVAMAMTQTAMSNPPPAPTNTVAQPTTEPTAKPTQQPTEMDIKALIDSSNILVYEDMIDYPQYITIVAKALKTIGGHQVYVGDAIGTLMNELNSGTKWDLIIIAAEARGAVSGDYWDVIKNHVDDGVALITEIWYLDSIGAGKISPLLYECGVEVQNDWQRLPGDDRLKYDINWSVPDSPVFNTPNRVTRFGASLTTPAWNGDIGDLMRLRSGSDATILASHASGQGHQTISGLITSCIGGRMILQTFDSHDYPTDPMVALWQNYIMYTLTNHFQAE